MTRDDGDALGHGLHVRIFEGASVGGPGRARNFVLNDTDYLSASHTIGSETTFSMAAWIKTTEVTGIAKTIMGLFSSDLNDDGYWEMQLTTGGALRGITESDAGLGTSNDFGATDLRDGEWHLVACARDGTTIQVWVDDGTDTPISETRTFPTIDTIAIGARVDSTPNNAFDGDIDECSIWEGTRITNTHVAALFALGNDPDASYLADFAANGIPEPTHHYKLSESTGAGTDAVGSLDLTDNGTTDTEGIPAGD